MKKYQIANKSITIITVAIYVIFMLFLCRASMMNIAILGALRSQIIVAVLTAVMFCLVAVYNYKKPQFQKSIKQRLILASLISLPFILSMILKSDYALFYVTIIAIFFEVAVLSLVVDIKQFARLFVFIIVALATYSLVVNYVLRPLVFSYWPNWMDFTNTAGARYMNLVFTNIRDLPYHFRNYCIFREPGQYAFMLLIAIFSNLFIVKKNKNKLIFSIILMLAMLSTFSPTGVVAMIVLMMSYLAYSWGSLLRQKFTTRRILVVVASIAITILGISIFVTSNRNISDTVTSSLLKVIDIKNESAQARLESVSVDAKMFINSPIIGNKSVDVLTAIQDNTFTPGVLLAIFGLLAGSISYVLWWKLTTIVIGKKHLVTSALILLAIFIGVSTQNMAMELFFYILPLLVYYDNSDKIMEKLVNLKNKVQNRRLI